MSHSNDAKSETDFAEFLEKTHQMGQNESAETSKVGREMMTTIRDPIKDVLQSNPPMENVVTLGSPVG